MYKESRGNPVLFFCARIEKLNLWTTVSRGCRQETQSSSKPASRLSKCSVLKLLQPILRSSNRRKRKREKMTILFPGHWCWSFKNNTDVTFEKKKAQGARTDIEHYNNGDMKLKADVIREAGFTPMQVSRFETLAAHPEIVEQAKAEALKDDSFQQYILKEEKENDQ